MCNFVINEFNPTFEVQKMGNKAFQNASFGNAKAIDRLAHWKALLVDPIFKFVPLPAVSHALSVQFPNNPSIDSHNLCRI